jgi:hypothetical protein
MMNFGKIRPGMVLRQEHDETRTIFVVNKNKKQANIFFVSYVKEDGYWLYRETVPIKEWNAWNKIYRNTEDCTGKKLHAWLITKIFAKDFAVGDSEV